MIIKQLNIVLFVSNDDARIIHRYSLRSSNFTFFISKTMFFFIPFCCLLYAYLFMSCCECEWVGEWMCLQMQCSPLDRLCFYLFLLFFFIFIVIAWVSRYAVRLLLHVYIQFGWEHQSTRTIQITFTKQLNCTNFYYFQRSHRSWHNRNEIYIRFSFQFRLYSVSKTEAGLFVCCCFCFGIF